MPIEPMVPFYGRRARELAGKIAAAARLRWLIQRARRRVLRSPAASNYRDVALTTASRDFSEALEMFEASAGARQYVARARRKTEHAGINPAGLQVESALHETKSIMQ